MKTRLEELFYQLADVSREERRRYFDRNGIDASTREELEALLSFDARGDTHLVRGIGEVAARALHGFDTGLQCGPYRLGGMLGRGGMGAVFLAERVDGEVTQRVAIKLLQPSCSFGALRERFLAERQILARLSHPNIAKMLDVGHREDGQPYLVMEYIDGKHIDAYCASLDLRQTIELFLRVCSAIGYLHRNLIVHRDLKPANILVTEDGQPKLLDFGIAKLLDVEMDAGATGAPMFTPDYASPEQAVGGPITTATDIYSLGAVLYRLLTGHSPRNASAGSGGSRTHGLSAVAAGGVPRPSTLAPALRGDLEAIVMKALRPESQNRYDSVEQFADDLENFLQMRPVRARRGNSVYRARRFLRRHWLPAAAASLGIVGLFAGAVVADNERAIARRRFGEVRQLANKLFDIDAEVRRVPGTAQARQLIVGTSLEYLKRISAGCSRDPELALELGTAYLRVARVQGVPVAGNLGQMESAEENLAIAERLLQSALAARPANRAALLRLAQTAHDRMLVARLSGRPEDALAFARAAADRLDRFQASAGDKAEAAAILNTHLNVAEQFSLAQQFDEAQRICDRAIRLAQGFHNDSYVGSLRWVSAEIARNRGDLGTSLALIRQSTAILDPGAGATDASRTMNFALALVHEGRILGGLDSISLGRSEEAVASFERAFKLADGFVHKDAHDQNSRGRLAMAGLAMADLLRTSDPRRSLAIYNHTLAHLAEIADNSSFRRFEASALAGSTYPLMRLGQAGEARRRLDAAFAVLESVNAYPAASVKPGSEAAVALSARADLEAAAGNTRGAVEVYRDLLIRVRASGAAPETSLRDAVAESRVLAALATLERRVGRRKEALALDAERSALWRRWNGRLPRSRFVAREVAEAVRSAVPGPAVACEAARPRWRGTRRASRGAGLGKLRDKHG